MPSAPTSVAELRRLTALWQRRLGLGHFAIGVRIGDPEEGCTAAVLQPRPEYEEAVITFAPWLVGRGDPGDGLIVPLEEWDARRVEVTVVHELLHVCVKPMTRTLDLVDGHLHRDSEAILRAALEAAEERVVDRLARALVAAFAV